MDKNTFIEKLFDLLKKQFGEEVTITQKKIEKSNGISYEGFTIKKKTEYISPVISIDNCYEDYSAGSSLDEIMKEIVHQYEESTRNNPFLSAQNIQNYEKIKDRLYMQVVNPKWNQKYLEHKYYVPFLDLAIVFYVDVQKKHNGILQHGGAAVTEELMNIWEIDGISSFKGVAVDRDQFLYSTFKKYSQEDIQSIISLGPPQAGVEKEEIDRIADKIIRKSKWSTTGVSFLTGMPGGFAMAATLPADILQFYLQAFILLQKLMFLYGQWDDDFFDSVGEMTEDARNVTIVYIGYMLGVEAATKVVGNIVAKATSRGFIIKTLIKSALGRELIIKIVRAIGIKSTAKAVSAGSKAIPILGAVVSGGITLISFAPMANRLKVTLSKMI